jgi:effector-binding domain-containing protein
MKFKWPFMILLVAVVLIATAGFLRYHITSKALVKASIFDLSAQLSDLQKWEKWDKLILHDKITPDFNRSANQVFLPGNIRVTLQVINPAAFVLQKHENARISSAQYITLKPVNADMLTQIEWTTSATGFEWLMAKVAGKDEIEDELNSLKAFAENPSNIYGYPIRVTKVSDPLLCLHRKTVAKQNVKNNIPQMLQELSQYLSKMGISYKRDHYYVSYFPVDSKDIEIAVGIAVTKEFKAQNNFELLKFPVNGRLLTGEYQGPANSINKLYAALDKYVTDKKMSKVALPMEKYPYSASLNPDTIKLQLIYPVY